MESPRTSTTTGIVGGLPPCLRVDCGVGLTPATSPCRIMYDAHHQLSYEVGIEESFHLLRNTTHVLQIIQIIEANDEKDVCHRVK